jgi:uncharacterized protein (DUF4415 family)
MSGKRRGSGRSLKDPDEAPEITRRWIEEADLYQGEKLVRRGRPKLANPKQLLSLRLPPEVIASWRASGPGWQTRMAELLEKASPKAGKRAG